MHSNHLNFIRPDHVAIQVALDVLQQHNILPVDSNDWIVVGEKLVEDFIREEELHDRFIISNERGQTLGEMSSGERKRAVLNHLLQNPPKVLLLDNWFSHVDVQGKRNFMLLLEGLEHTQLINLVSHSRDFLRFSTDNYLLEKGGLVPWRSHQLGLSSSVDQLPQPIKEPKSVADPLVKMKNVRVSYLDRTVLKNINWEVNAGEFWQITGPNGAGKTTLLNLISGDNPKAYGQDITLFGIRKGSGESVWDIKQHIGYFSTNMTHNFWRNQTLLELILSGYFDSIGLYQKPSELQGKRALEWLELIGLADKSKQPFRRLTKGQQRLVLIARAMVKHPPLLILDEPCAAMDENSSAQVIALLNFIHSNSSTAILYVSHWDEPLLEVTHRLEM